MTQEMEGKNKSINEDLVEKIMYVIDHNTEIPLYNNRSYVEKQIREIIKKALVEKRPEV